MGRTGGEVLVLICENKLELKMNAGHQGEFGLGLSVEIPVVLASPTCPLNGTSPIFQRNPCSTMPAPSFSIRIQPRFPVLSPSCSTIRTGQAVKGWGGTFPSAWCVCALPSQEHICLGSYIQQKVSVWVCKAGNWSLHLRMTGLGKSRGQRNQSRRQGWWRNSTEWRKEIKMSWVTKRKKKREKGGKE